MQEAKQSFQLLYNEDERSGSVLKKNEGNSANVLYCVEPVSLQSTQLRKKQGTDQKYSQKRFLGWLKMK